MGWRSRVANWLLRDTTGTKQPAQWFLDWALGEETATGLRVTVGTAKRQSAVWSCVRVRSEDIGKLPCFLHRRLADGSKERATDHPLYRMIHDGPNPRHTAFEFKQLMQMQLDLRGNALAVKEFDGRGRIVALWPVDWAGVMVLQTPEGRELFYRVRLPDGGTSEPLPSEAVLHLRGLSLDGKVGLSPIAEHRETIGLALAAQKYGAAFFGNSARPNGAVKLPGVLSKEAAEALRADWEQKYRGTENAHRIAIFDGGMEWIQMGMDNRDAQYLESRKFSNQDIYRIFRVPPHKVGDLEKATFSNIEQQALEYVVDCLMSEMVRWEQALNRDLLTDSERSEYFFEFLPDALLRGDIKSRYEAYAIARNWGILSVNDIRDRENMNRIPKGDIYLQPLNMVEAGTAPTPSVEGARSAVRFLQAYIAHHETAKPNGFNGHGEHHRA